jgi:hypothetical protein
MIEPLIRRSVDVELGAEWTLVQLPLGALVDDSALVAAERRALDVAFQEILAKRRCPAIG